MHNNARLIRQVIARQPKAEWFEEPAVKTETKGLIYTAKEQVNLEFLDDR
ncbi:hypothetical protein [[Eubacterium] cellulosolvens]